MLGKQITSEENEYLIRLIVEAIFLILSEIKSKWETSAERRNITMSPHVAKLFI